MKKTKIAKRKVRSPKAEKVCPIILHELIPPPTKTHMEMVLSLILSRRKK